MLENREYLYISLCHCILYEWTIVKYRDIHEKRESSLQYKLLKPSKNLSIVSKTTRIIELNEKDVIKSLDLDLVYFTYY